jgi:3-oxoadipate enol-lactonase
MPFTAVNGSVVHFRDDGPRGARTIVFSNSLGTDFRIWDDLVARLGGALRLIRYDKRGHGLSELPAGAASIEDYGADLAGLLDKLEVRKALIVGLSMGGLIAQELYRRRPDLVGALALCDAAAKIGTHESWSARIAAIERGGLEAIADVVMTRWFAAPFHELRSDELRGWRLMLTRSDQAGYLAACLALRDADLRPDCAAIAVPTLCLVGDEDGSTPPPIVRELSQSIPNARFEIIKGAGHLPNIEKPDAFAALITAHLTAHLAATPA